MNRVRLIATDVDGTLLTPDKTLSDCTLSAIQDAQKAGIRVCVCSGRNHTEVKQLVRRAHLDDLAVINNGACTIDVGTGFEHSVVRMQSTQAKNILWALIGDAAHHPGVTISVAGTFDTHNPLALCDDAMRQRAHVSHADSGFTNERYHLYSDIDSFIQACANDMQRILYGLDASAHGHRIQQMLSGFEAVTITQGMPGKLEILPHGTDKGAGLSHLCRVLGIDPCDCMAIGDGANDIGMLQSAGLGIAMGNAVLPLKQAADAVTDGNENDGFAKAVFRYALNRG